MSIPMHTDQRKSACFAGAALMIMMVAAAFSYGFAHGSILDPEDAGATFQNIQSHGSLLTAEIFGWIVILACDVVAAWACYVYLKPIDEHLSLLGGWLRLIYSAILGTAVLNLIQIRLLSNNQDHLSGFTKSQLEGNVMLHFQAFDSIWSVGLIIFGAHLLILAILALRSEHIPKWIGLLLLLAAIGYMSVHLSKIILADGNAFANVLEYIFIIPMTAGEAGFGLWLLFKGGKKAF